VIAIENTRLLTELRESLERQTATADVLGIISSSPGELEPVFNAILQNAIRICGAQNATLWLYENGQVRRAARHSGLLGATVPPRPSARAALMRALQTKQIVYLDDYRNDQAYRDGDPFVVPAVDQLSIRTYVAVPMLKEGEPIGVISIYRTEVRPFSEKQIQLIARPGGHCNRECAAAQRVARIATAADRDGRRAPGHQSLDIRLANRSEHTRGIGSTALQSGYGANPPSQQRRA
jgi:GAF domain-containing protein